MKRIFWKKKKKKSNCYACKQKLLTIKVSPKPVNYSNYTQAPHPTNLIHEIVIPRKFQIHQAI